jgi:hypothetical protein
MFGITKRSGEAIMHPALVDKVTGWSVHSVSSGNTSTAVASERSLITWGPSPTFGELGYGADAGIKSSMYSKEVDDLKGCRIKQVASGLCHTLAIVEINDDVAEEYLLKLPIFSPDEVIVGEAPLSASDTVSNKGQQKKKSSENGGDENGEEESEDAEDEESDEEFSAKTSKRNSSKRRAPRSKAKTKPVRKKKQ